MDCPEVFNTMTVVSQNIIWNGKKSFRTNFPNDALKLFVKTLL